LKLLNEVDRLSHTGGLVTAFGLRRRLIPEGRYDSLHSVYLLSDCTERHRGDESSELAAPIIAERRVHRCLPGDRGASRPQGPLEPCSEAPLQE
jgi:hypothetical protein